MASAKAPFADLHVHTWFSDSSLSPAQAVEEAVAHGVGVLAIADHEGFSGSLEAEPYARAAGLAFIRAAELECTWEDKQLHILCYGARPRDPALTALAARSRRILDEMSDRLIERMKGEYPALSLEEYQEFSYDRSLGGWKGLHYLLAKGVTQTLRQGMGLYAAYGVTYEEAGFPGLGQLLEAIRRAGGRAVLAHPGHSLGQEDLGALERQVEALVERGLEGVECHYPLHGPDTTAMLRRLCLEKGLLITAGSDCHGTFGRTRVGEMDVERDMLRLEGLL